MRGIMLAAAVGAIAGDAGADEVWTSEFGEIVYETDVNDYIAVLSIPAEAFGTPSPPGSRAMIYVPGLGGNTQDRFGMFEGYWTAPSDSPGCDFALMPPGAKPALEWGRVRIMFDRVAAPSGFTLLYGFCAWEPTATLRADLP